MIRTTLEHAQQNFKELFEAALRGEDVYVTANGEQDGPTVRLIADVAPYGRPQFGSGRGSFWIADDFDDPIPDFDDYQ